MNYLAHADAIILDLRSNSGGSGFMVKLISSYFIEDYTKLWSFEWNEEGKQQIEQHWILPFVPGRTLFEKDLYILISQSTFSAAEGFSYNMKGLKRATLIGETTRGGGIAGELEIINDNFIIFVPKYKSINPITNDYIDIEGQGVKPHIEVSADRALHAAHLLAINTAIKKSKNLKPNNELYWIKDWIKTKQNNGFLYLKESSSYIEYAGFCSKLIPMSESLFILEKVHSVRIKFETDEDHNITATLLYLNGNTVKAKKQ